MRKPVFQTEHLGFQTGQTQIRLCSHRKWFEFLDYVEEGLYFLCSENKENDQLHSYCAADLHLCFRICKNTGFLITWLL